MRSARGRGWDESCCHHGDDGKEHSHEDWHRLWRERVREYTDHEPQAHWFFGGRRFAPWWAARGPGYVNPLVGLLLSRGGGLLPLVVLHLLSRGPRYGNDIMREIEALSQGAWASNPGAVYPLLRLLEHRGLVIGDWEDTTKRTRRVYRLTDAGRTQYVRLKELMKPGLREAVDVMRALFDELYAPEGAASQPREDSRSDSDQQ